MLATGSALSALSALSAAAVERFAADGFAIAPDLLEADESDRFRAAAVAYAGSQRAKPGEVFRQLVNVWPNDAVLRGLTFHPRVIAAVQRLAQRPMRLFHDQILIKDARNGAASEFHQDKPYWPLRDEAFTVSIWIALGDCPVERGCMGFIPGSHRRSGLAIQMIMDPRSLFDQAPELEWAERVQAPLKAGGATFHQGWTAHRAGPNETDAMRVAFSAIYVDATERVARQVGWLPRSLEMGAEFPDDACPVVCS